MILSREITCQYFEIWAPRYHDRKVLLAAHKVGSHNKIVFTKAPTLPGEWYISGRDVHQCDIESNGSIACYAVPMRFLEPIEHPDQVQIPRSAKQLELI